jgi:hypothetical protein
MAKAETIERFRITCEVEAAAMGDVIVALSRLGITNLHHELVTEVRTFRKNKPRKNKAPVKRNISGKPGTDVIIDYANKHGGKFDTQALIKIFEAQGRSPKSVSPQINTLLERKMVRRTGKGAYALLAKAKSNGAAEVTHG